MVRARGSIGTLRRLRRRASGSITHAGQLNSDAPLLEPEDYVDLLIVGPFRGSGIRKQSPYSIESEVYGTL